VRGSTLAAGVTTVVLLAATVRMVTGVVGGVLAYQHHEFVALGATQVHRTFAALIVGGGFADGQGVLLLGFLCLLCWWQADSTASPARTKVHVAWLGTLGALSVLGSLAVVAGTVGYYDQAPDRWVHVVGSGGFALAYAILGAVVVYVAYACGKLRSRAGAAQEGGARAAPRRTSVTW
jgi:hypothetical protein